MPRRYPPALVVLHWLSALLILGALLGGTFNMANVPNSDPAKLATLRMHMIVGIAILLLIGLRLVVRARKAMPQRLDSGGPVLNRIASGTHHALYLLVIAMALSGLALAAASGLGAALFAGAPLPESFHGFGARAAHGLLAKLLMLLIGLHVVAALWHAVVKRDGILARMWLGR